METGRAFKMLLEADLRPPSKRGDIPVIDPSDGHELRSRKSSVLC